MEGSFKVNGGANFNFQDEFTVSGGALGELVLTIGVDVNAVDGLLYVGIEGSTSIKATGDFFGKTKPAELDMELKLKVGGLDLSYRKEIFWGAWKDEDTWEIFKAYQIYPSSGKSSKINLIPGIF